MAWTEITRLKYRREGLRYASDTTETEWAMLEELLPRRRRLGRPRTVDLRGIPIPSIEPYCASGDFRCQFMPCWGEICAFWRDTVNHAEIDAGCRRDLT